MAYKPLPLVQELTDDGSPSGNFNIVGAYSPGSPGLFFITPQEPGEVLKITRILPYLEDGGAFDSDKYGNGTALANGVDLYAELGGVQYTLVGQQKIKHNAHWTAKCFDRTREDFGQGTTEMLVGRYTIAKFAGTGLVLEYGDKLVAKFTDSTTHLVAHHITAEGEYLRDWHQTRRYN